MRRLHTVQKPHIILVILIVVASFLRVYKLDTAGILFFDAGHDLITAHTALADGHLPLQGIASSRPWLHQGPLAIWISMLVMLVAGTSTLAQSLVFALIGIAALIALYEFLTICVNKQVAHRAVAILAVMPLAVAHSRVPYHTTPIPVVLVFYVWAIHSLWHKASLKQLGIAILTGLVLIQFELALIPLLLLIPYAFLRTKQKIQPQALWVVAVALILGLLPQLILSSTGADPVLFSYGKFAIHQILNLPHTQIFSLAHLQNTLQAFWMYGRRLFGVDSTVLGVIGGLSLLVSLLLLTRKAVQKKLPPAIEIVLVCFSISTLSYFIVGNPSEAYFPPYFITIPILIAYACQLLPQRVQILSTLALAAFVVSTAVAIYKTNFFVGTASSFRYESVGESRALARYFSAHAGGPSYRLTTSEGSDVSMPAFFDNIRWIAISEGLATPSNQGRLFYLEGTDQPDPPESIFLRQFGTRRVYWALDQGQL
ncbi:glycosyltransferase family 39 protein [Candidatus Woesebacteria bacterium]|nr:glycosyltransferase family 39 protein [Candidatus Woesebacteria bacterium]